MKARPASVTAVPDSPRRSSSGKARSCPTSASPAVGPPHSWAQETRWKRRERAAKSRAGRGGHRASPPATPALRTLKPPPTPPAAHEGSVNESPDGGDEEVVNGQSLATVGDGLDKP